MRYSLRHGSHKRGNALRHWVVRARAESGDPWTMLGTFKDDEGLSEVPFSTASWMLGTWWVGVGVGVCACICVYAYVYGRVCLCCC